MKSVRNKEILSGLLLLINKFRENS